MAKKLTRKAKPTKPYAEYPLYAHAAGVWAKKIRGKVHYFGPWSDPTAAVQNYLDQKDYLLAGTRPPQTKQTVAELLDLFMDGKQAQTATGDLATATFKDYEATCGIICKHFGKHRPVDSLAVDDFNGLRVALSLATRKGKSRIGVHAFKRRLTVARMAFGDQPKANLKVLKAPPKRLMRAAREEKKEQLYADSDLRLLIEKASPEMKAMILLGINCAFGPQDCSTLPTKAVNLRTGWHTFGRPKTGAKRKCPLWPETVKAIKAITGNELVFEASEWNRWRVRDEFTQLCAECGVVNHGFYSLRRTFETIATTAEVNQAAIDQIMGHLRDDMASVYRQKVFDDQLKKCVDHVRAWYQGKKKLR